MLIDSAANIKSRITKKQIELKGKELEGCTFVPVTNSRRHAKEKEQKVKRVDKELELFNIIMTQGEEAARKFKMDKYLEQQQKAMLQKSI